MRNKTRMSASPLLLSTVQKSYPWQSDKKKIKGIHIRKKEVKPSLSADDMILLHKTLKTPPKNYWK